MSDRSLKVMTFNIVTSTKKRNSHPWSSRKHSIAKIFNDQKPDVVGTQEANYKQLIELAELLPEYDFVGEGNLGRQKADCESSWYCATFFRRETVRLLDDSNNADTYWLSPTPDVPASQFRLGTRPRLVTWNTFQLIETNSTFVFGTTHLEAINSSHRKRSAQLLRQYVDRKVEEMGDNTPVFLTGDFNAVSKSNEVKAFSSNDTDLQPMFDAWSASGRDESRDSATFRGLGLRDKLGHMLLGPRRIDYVFFRPLPIIRSVNRIGFDNLNHEEHETPSDHYPVMAEFALAS